MSTLTVSTRFWRHSQRILRATVYCFNVHTLVLCLLSCLSCLVAQHLGLTYNLEFSFVALGITFPVTFNIAQAFTRRERALMTLAEMKASIIALYWMHRDWAQDDNFPASLGNDRHSWAIEFANTAMDFLSHMQRFLLTADGYESLSEVRMSAKRSQTLALMLADTRLHPDPDSMSASFITRVHTINRTLPGYRHITAAYRCLSRMSAMNEYLTFKANYRRGGEGGMSRTAQYLRYLIAQMEQLRMIKIYRTPFMLRYCCSVLTHLGAIVLGPYFMHIGACTDESRTAWNFGCPAPYVMACIYGVICMLLLNVQASAEMPFDMSGLDDVFTELTEEFADVLDMDPIEPINDSGACFKPTHTASEQTAAGSTAAAAVPGPN